MNDLMNDFMNDNTALMTHILTFKRKKTRGTFISKEFIQKSYPPKKFLLFGVSFRKRRDRFTTDQPSGITHRAMRTARVSFVAGVPRPQKG